MSTMIGSLLVSLGLDSAEFRSDLNRSRQQMTTFQRSVQSSANLVRGAIAGMVAGFSVATVTDAIRRGLDYASALGEQAAAAGVTTRSLQEYRYAATQVGLTTEQMDAALSRLTRTLGQAASGGRQQAAIFAQLGVAVRDANGNVREAGDVMPDLAAGLQRLGSDAERAAALTAIFGRSGQQLATLLGEGAAGVNELRDAAHRLGIVMDDTLINQADEAADTLAALSQVLSAQLAVAAANAAPALTAMANALSYLIENGNRASAVMRNLQASLPSFMRPAIFSNPALNPFGAARDLLNATFGRTSRGAGFQGRRGGVGANADAVEAAAARPGAVAAVALGGGGGGGGGRTRGGGGGGRAANDNSMARELQRIMDDAFPIRAAQRELTEGTQALDAALARGAISAADHAAAVAHLRTEYGTLGEGNVIAELAQDARDQLAEIELEVPRVEDITRGLAEHFERQTESMEESARRQQEAIQGVLSSLQTLADGIRSGNVLDIISGVLGALDQIGGIVGGFNLGPLQFGRGMKAYASGTPYHPGGLAMVGERGREIVNLPRGSQVIPNHALGGMGGASVQVIPSPYFDVVVNGHVQRGITGAAPAIAEGGAALAQGRLGFRQSRRVA